ncbi:hypothetical protein F504_5098 (plasmid) [Ralstonia pseudosolanacearum FQY_4]|nr:hypothetical protein F504_5094 [Ralstonia pseudosolanacearum FQY_4]AGH87603.1 hypothetical protein F504_5098 [Ralstonia pseudosolanacearum FQY_4]
MFQAGTIAALRAAAEVMPMPRASAGRRFSMSRCLLPAACFAR